MCALGSLFYEVDAAACSSHSIEVDVARATLSGRLSACSGTSGEVFGWIRLRPRALTRLYKLFSRLCVSSNPTKGYWQGAELLDHLGVHI